MSNENIAFRTSVNGYNKTDVYNYLDSLNRDIIARDEAAKQKTTALESECNALKEEKSAVMAELEVANTQIEALKDELAQKDALISELDSATVKISLELDALSEQYASLLSEYRNLAKSLDEIEELRKKAQAYDKISEKIRARKGIVSTKTQTSTASAVKADIDRMMSASAREMLDYIQSTQNRFNSAIENAQNETHALKARIDGMINASKEKILDSIK